MADKDSKGDDDMDDGLFGSGKDIFGRDKYDNKSGLYIPSFERGDIDWSNLILNNASRFRPQTVNGNENTNQGGKSKPAWDADGNGQLWQIEANRWYRIGNGQSITIAASSVNLKNISPSIAKGWKVNDIYYVSPLTKNFLSDGTVFGTLEMRYLGNNQVQILTNMYDFDIGADKGHAWSKEFFRNVSTWFGEQVATGFGMAPGNGTPYLINFSGVATLGKGPK